MRIFRLLLISLIVSLATLGMTQQDGQPFRLVFANTSLSSVLRAVGIRTGANIVYVGKEDPTVTLDVTAGNADEARVRNAIPSATDGFRRLWRGRRPLVSEEPSLGLPPRGRCAWPG